MRAKGNAEASKVVERVDREIHRPDINIRNWETEAPSSEVRFKKKIKKPSRRPGGWARIY